MRYFVNGVEFTFIKRCLRSKTFYGAASIILGGVGVALEGSIGWKAALVSSGISAALYVVRDLKKLSDLKKQAEDPNMPHVTAEPKG